VCVCVYIIKAEEWQEKERKKEAQQNKRASI
jgi:hypothetical protein